jgi:YD repeat-containing protein
MKSKFLIVAGAFGCLFTSSSCSKKSSGPAKSSCELVTIKTNITGGGGETATLTYDAQDRVIGIETVIPGSSTINKTFIYSGNTVIVNETLAGKPYSTDTITLNSSGQIQTDHNTYIAGGTSYLLTYTFSGTQVQKLVQQDPGGNVLAMETYTWSGGNLISTTSESGGTAFTANYSYNNLPAQTGDYWSEYQLVATPVAYIKTANMVTAITNPNETDTFFYSSDSTGKITGVSAMYGSSAETLSYQWSCQ